MKSVLFTLLSAASLVLVSCQTNPQGSPILGHNHNLSGESIGLFGYDPVSYFPEGGDKPEKGSINFTGEHEGVTYRFASKEHLTLFQDNPAKYLPAYGGWCAWAVGAIAKRVDVDPESYQIRDGRLYVFYRDQSLVTRDLWLKEPENLIAKGDANWPALAR